MATTRGLWSFAQAVALLATVVLIGALLAVPDTGLKILWNVLIPLVPASLLITPHLWRNVCPLATLNKLGNGPWARRTLTTRMAALAGVIAIVLLFAMVPARRFLFNTDGVALAATIVAVGVLALALGAVFDMKAGFCNAICPVLPVERLYGQRPLVNLGNPRCPACTHCTQTGCIDLNATKSVAQTLGPARRSSAWLTTGFGAFAAAFPGFVMGYYATQDVALQGAGGVYLEVFLWAIASYVLTTAIVRFWDIPATRMLPMLGGVAAAVYYWFASPLLAAGLSLAPLEWPLRIGFLSLVAAWSWRAVRHPPREAPSPAPS